MATGDAALAAGYELVDPATDLVRDGAEVINKTRDYAGLNKTEVRPIARGGTGSPTATGARQNLEIYVQSAAPAHQNGRVWIKTP